MEHSISRTLDRISRQVMELQQQQLQMQQQQAKDCIVLKNLQEHLSSSSIGLLPKEVSKTDKDTLSYQLAKNVSSVVGLKEAITWKSKFLKCIWTIALCAGVAATAFFLYESWNEYTSHPTASKVEIIGRPLYEYPPVILCPNKWLDADKALSLGLSMEGLKYSLGYINVFEDKVGPDNEARGRQEFYNFYEKHGFASFDDYLINISHEVSLQQSEGKYSNTFQSYAYCSRCNTSFLPKMVTHSGVCYNFQMSPENGKRRLSLVSRRIGMQLSDRSLGLIKTQLWGLYVTKKTRWP